MEVQKVSDGWAVYRFDDYITNTLYLVHTQCMPSREAGKPYWATPTAHDGEWTCLLCGKQAPEDTGFLASLIGCRSEW